MSTPPTAQLTPIRRLPNHSSSEASPCSAVKRPAPQPSSPSSPIEQASSCAIPECGRVRESVSAPDCGAFARFLNQPPPGRAPVAPCEIFEPERFGASRTAIAHLEGHLANRSQHGTLPEIVAAVGQGSELRALAQTSTRPCEFDSKTCRIHHLRPLDSVSHHPDRPMTLAPLAARFAGRTSGNVEQPPLSQTVRRLGRIHEPDRGTAEAAVETHPEGNVGTQRRIHDAIVKFVAKGPLRPKIAGLK